MAKIGLLILLLCPSLQAQYGKTYSMDPADLHCKPLETPVADPMCDGCMGDPVFECKPDSYLAPAKPKLDEIPVYADCLAEPCNTQFYHLPPQWNVIVLGLVIKNELGGMITPSEWNTFYK